MLQLITNLQTTKTSEKVRALEQFFSTATDSDKLWIIALFTGRRPKRTIKVSLLRQWACEFTQTPDWLFEESYAIVGDLAETIALLLPTTPKSVIHFDLTFWMEELKNIRSREEASQKEWVFNAWEILDAHQRFVFNKLLTGGFRIGVSMALIVQALEKATGIPREDLHFRLSGNWDPYKTTFQDLIVNPQQSENPSKPYPFCLAYPLEDFQALGDLNEWQIEYKWDGIRGQLIKRGDTITLWSRGEEIITPSFPEIAEGIAKLDFEGVLDGEIIAWDFQNHQPRPCADLQKRLGRKSPGKKTITSNPCAFICYDLLEHNTTDLRHQPLSTRRNLLEQALQTLREQSEPNTSEQSEPITSTTNPIRPKGVPYDQRESHTSASRVSREASAESPANKVSILHSEKLNPESHQQLHLLREQATLHHTEGLMLKRLNSTYGVGRKRGDWWKWKIEPETADAVLIYAQKGHGKRASRYTDFTFALKKGEELVPFAKAYSGLSNKELEEINAWIKDNTRERFGPVCSVNAELVFEIAFEGVNISSRHKSGIAVRFPRIVRWRRDKKVSDINSVDDLLPN
jgi:DNA ligase-1